MNQLDKHAVRLKTFAMADAPTPTPAPKPKPPPPFHFGPPEKTNWLKRFVLWGFVALAIWGIVYMIYANKPMPTLSCSTYNGAGLWSAFGRCQTTDQ